jgi:hypothetical protein
MQGKSLQVMRLCSLTSGDVHTPHSCSLHIAAAHCRATWSACDTSWQFYEPTGGVQARLRIPALAPRPLPASVDTTVNHVWPRFSPSITSGSEDCSTWESGQPPSLLAYISLLQSASTSGGAGSCNVQQKTHTRSFLITSGELAEHHKRSDNMQLPSWLCDALQAPGAHTRCTRHILRDVLLRVFCCRRRRNAQPRVGAFGAAKHAQGTTGLTYHAGLASANCMT